MPSHKPSSNSTLLKRFMTLSIKAEQYIDKHSNLTVLSQGALVIQKGDPVAGAYIVVTGRLRVFCYSARGTEATLYCINPGETCVFALNSLFKDLRYPAWVEADLQTELLVIKGATFQFLFREEPAIQDLTVNALSTAAYRLMQEMEQLQGWSLKQRLINFLLNVASSEGVVAFTQQQISNHLGTTREVIARLLSDLSSRALITTGRGRITLESTRKLSELLID